MNKDWIDIEVLENYLDGKLDAKAMNRVEREALEDPFVAEALAGLSNSPKRSLESISLLQKQLQERVAEHQHQRKASVITWQRLSIAATAAVLFISVGIIFWMKQNNYQEMLAKQPKKVDVNLAPRVFKDSVLKPETEVAAIRTAAADSFKAKAIEKAITVAKADVYAFTKKKANAIIATAVPAAASVTAAEEPVSSLNEVVTAAAPQAQTRQKSLAFSSTTLDNAEETKTVTGKVIDLSTGEALPNAGIYVGRPMKGTGSADQNGNYTVNIPANATDLTFTFPGYENQHIKIIGNSFDVALKESKNELNEVVIRGYQKRLREQTTGSSYVVTGKEVQDIPVANVEQLLQGKVSGLNIQNNTGAPGLRGSTNIRGISSISEANAAQPANGWDKYRAYLIKTNRFSKETKPAQTAEYKFTVKNGRPTEIVTVKGVSRDYDDEAIRLIKNGPGWKLPDPTRSEVNVVLKF